MRKLVLKHDPEYKGLQHLHDIELSFHVTVLELVELQARFLGMASKHAKPVSHLMNKNDFKFWDGKQPVFHIDCDEAPKMLQRLEVAVANFFFHAMVLVERISEITLKMHELDPRAWPVLATLKSQLPNETLISQVNDSLRASGIEKTIRKLVRKTLREDSRQAVARKVPGALAEAFSGSDHAAWFVWVGLTEDVSYVSKALSDIVFFRNSRAHALYFAVHAISPPPTIIYSSTANELAEDKGKIRFTSEDISNFIPIFMSFVEWWSMRSAGYLESCLHGHVDPKEHEQHGDHDQGSPGHHLGLLHE